MRGKKLIIGIVIVIAFIGIILIAKNMLHKMKESKPVAAALGKKGAAKMPVKKIISKGQGGLTVRILNSKSMEIPMKIKAFKIIDGRSSVYTSSSVGGRMQEIAPGNYDIEIDTVPQKIFKNIKVSEGKETVEDLGCVTGSLIVRTVNSKNTAAYYPMRILYPRTNDMVTAFMTNKAIEIVPGVYDIEIGTSPRQYKKDVKVDAGKEAIMDLGCLTGSLTVKVVDEDGKNVRYSVRVTKQDNNEIVSSTVSNKSIELSKGTYNIDLLSTPKQSKKDIKVNVGEDMAVEFTVKKPIVPQKSVAIAPSSAVSKPAKARVAASKKQ